MSLDTIPRKPCTRCGQNLPLVCFTKNNNRADGLKVWCVKCCAEYHGRVWHPKCLAEGMHECGVCHEWFPDTYEYFHKSNSSKRGLGTVCIECAKVKTKTWYWDNLDYARESTLEYARTHKAEAVARTKKWAEDHPERTKEIHRVIHRRNINDPVKHARMKASSLQWQKDNPIKMKARTHKRRALMMAAEGSFTDNDIRRLFDEQESRCAYCGITLSWDIPGDIHIDHIQPLSRGGSNWPVNLACACADCNLSKSDSTLTEWAARRGW